MTTAILVVRLGSSRFPGKVMSPLCGKPMLERMIERVAAAKSVRQIVLATTDLPEDDRLETWATAAGVGCVRGSSDDVLGRVCQAAQTAGADPIVELLGDNPMVHSRLIDDVVDFYRAGSYDYAASVTTEYPHAGPEFRKFPIGIRVQVMSRAALVRCEKLSTDPADREHSTRYALHHPDQFRLGYFEAKGSWQRLNRPELTFAVNYRQNLDLLERIFEPFLAQDPNFSLETAVEAYDALPPEQKEWMGNLENIRK